MVCLYAPSSIDTTINWLIENLDSETDILNSLKTLCLLSLFTNHNIVSILHTALQRHYSVLQALALDEDKMPDEKDETLPDEEGFTR